MKNPKVAFYVRELERKINERINSIRRELDNLNKLGLVIPFKKQRKKFYQVNDRFILFEELRSLILKAEILSPIRLKKQIERLGKIKLALLTKFILQPKSNEVDIFIVGKVSRPRLLAFISKFQKEYGREINYTVMEPEEFSERSQLKDVFLEKIFTNEYLRII